MKKIYFIFVVVLISSAAWSQTFDCFGGLVTYAGGTAAGTGAGVAHQQTAVCSQATTVPSCTVTDGTKYAIGEPMIYTGSGTALDWSNAVCLAHNTEAQGGAWLITNIVGNTLTLSSTTSQTVTSHTGTIKPMRWYSGTVDGHVGVIDPLDHRLFLQQVVQASDAAIAKYGSLACNTAKDEFIAWNNLGNGAGEGFNSTGQSNTDNNYYGACAGNPQIPFQPEDFESSYYSDNLTQGSFSGVSQPGKDMNWATDTNYNCQGISRASLDFFDPRWEQYAQGWMAGSNDFPTFRKSGWLIFADHQDSGVGGAAPTNAGWAFNTSPTGKNDCHQGILVLATSPVQTVSNNVLYGANNPYIFPDAKVYMKISASTNIYGESTTSTPPPACDPTVANTICSLQDYFTAKYTTVSGLNSAWGTSYTTLGSSGTQVTGETFGTGNGSQLTFTHSMGSALISPFSIQLTVNGVVIGGDCPAFAASCTATAGKGQFIGTNIASGSCTYSTGASCTVTFTAGHAPGAGIIVGVNYIWGGWGASGTGLVDEDGTHLGTGGVCPVAPPSFQNNHTYSVGDQIKDGSNSWQYVLLPVTGPSQSSGTPTFSATYGATTVSGGVTFTSIGPPVCGSGGSFTGTLPSAQMGADLDAYLQHVDAAYFSALRTAQNTVAPDSLNGCSDQMGVWQSPPNKYVLLAARNYCDVAMGDLWGPDLDGAGPAKYDYFTANWPGPITNYQSPVTTQSAFPPNGNVPSFSTQQGKGQWWYTTTNYWLTQVGRDGLKHGAGLQWTSNIDGVQGASFGFETANYNPYNTLDDVSGSTPVCQFNSPALCGGETSAIWNGTDSITHANCGLCIADAEKQWFAAPPSSGTTPASTPSAAIIARAFDQFRPHTP